MELGRDAVYVLNTYPDVAGHLTSDFFRCATTDPLQSHELVMRHAELNEGEAMEQNEIRTTRGVHFDQAIMHEPDSSDTTRITTCSHLTRGRHAVMVAETDYV